MNEERKLRTLKRQFQNTGNSKHYILNLVVAFAIVCLPAIVYGAAKDNQPLSEQQPPMLGANYGNQDAIQNASASKQNEYVAEVKGRVDYIGPGIMIVIGQYVDIRRHPSFTSKMKGIASVSDIPLDAMVEVTGNSDNMGNIIATKITLDDHMVNTTDTMEAEGTIQELDLIGDSFMIGDQLIYFDPTIEKFALENGVNVEVYLTMDSAGDLHAIKIVKDRGYFNKEKDVKVGGRVTAGINTDGTFLINGRPAKLSKNVKFKDGLTKANVVNGASLELEGYLDSSGKLMVYRVSAEHRTG